MKAIFLYGHTPTVTAAYRHVDALLRKHHVNDIVLAMVAGVDEATAQSLRQGGGELWFCAPSDTPAAEGDQAQQADRTLLAVSWHELARQACAALGDFLGGARVPA